MNGFFSLPDFITAFNLFLNVLFLRKHKKVNIAAVITCLMTFGLSLYLLYIGGAEQAGFVWCLILPITAAFLLGIKMGTILITPFFSVALISLLVPFNPFLLVEYSGAVKFNFFTIYILVSLIAIYYEYSRQTTHKELVSNERRFRSLIENSTSVYAVIDSNGTVLYESQSLKKVYGYEPHELMGKNIYDLVHPDDVPYAREKIMESVSHPHIVKKAEVRYRHKDGSRRDIEVSGVSLLDDPTINGIILTCHDVTERKRAENEIKPLSGA